MRRTLFAVLCAFAAMPLTIPTIALAENGARISGRALDSNGGLPVSNATVELEQGDKIIGTLKTAADGSFTFSDEEPGVYNVLILASGYQTTRSRDVYVIASHDRVEVQMAVERTATTGLRTIGGVRVAGQNSLQTTTTINEHVNASILQDQNYARSGDALKELPFVNGKTASALAAGLTLSIRGFNSTETATLLDGHPIGPIGARGLGFDFGVSPFWGLSGMEVTFGSGATGMYGVPTIAGAINFQTISPTREPHSTITQGLGNNAKLMTGVQTTGSFGKLGYAFAYGVQGTDGEIGPTRITQQSLLTAPSASCPGGVNSTPSIRAVDVASCTYAVSGVYDQRNALAKLTYDFDPKTSLLISAYNATMWDDSTGNGDTDNNPYAFMLYNAQNSLSKNGNKNIVKLPGGGSVTCNASFVVLNDSPAGYQCMAPQQYAATFSGPAGGGVGRWHGAQNQDYHARLTRQITTNNALVLDGFVDNYGFENAKSLTKGFDDIFRTNGFLVSDEFSMRNNDAAVGVYFQHQQHTGNLVNKGLTSPIKQLDLTTTNYFVRDSYTVSRNLSAFADVSVLSSHDTSSTTVNPRLSLVFRPASSDVMRVTAGRSTSEPDPSLLFGPFTFSAVQSYNPSCGSALNSIGSGSSPLLKPETANDVEVAYGHRFSQQILFQADAYSSRELNPLVSGVFPLSVVPAGQMLTQSELQQYLDKLNGTCGGGYTAANVGVSTTFNAGSATYRGVHLNSTVGIGRNLRAIANYAIQSASYSGIPDSILKNNVTLINGSQFVGIPLHQAGLAFAYANPSGLAARIDGYYVGGNNFFNRGPYMYANANISRTVGSFTANFGVYNLFNSIAQEYGYVGAGTFIPENGFGKDTNSFQQGTEQFGLPYKQFWLTFTYRT